MLIWQRIRLMRERLNLKQTAAAKISKLCRTYYGDIERGQSPGLTYEQVENIAKGFEVHIVDIILCGIQAEEVLKIESLNPVLNTNLISLIKQRDNEITALKHRLFIKQQQIDKLKELNGGIHEVINELNENHEEDQQGLID
ncbi:MAG: hypothetical protein JWN76_491 [Chitinophagaceae bacterium]|nr:hypothetical protein [Chitinophagaceae bacterium]